MRIKRAITILKYLEEKTDIRNTVSIKELQLILEDDGIIADESTIKRDIIALLDSNSEIKYIATRHNVYRYYIQNKFSTSEIRILLDGVASNKFVSDKQKNIIREKLLSKVSIADRIQLKNQVKTKAFINNGADILKNIETIHRAIAEKKYVVFNIINRNKINKLESNLTDRVIVPIAIYYENDRYYLIAINEKKEARNYRIDRITNVRLGDYHLDDLQVDLDKYPIKNFDMFPSKETVQARFRVDNNLRHSIIEKFGETVEIREDPEDENYFVFTEEVGINQGLTRWILKQGSQLEVIHPPQLKLIVKDELKKMMELYK